jgi:hypothetical protein
VRTLNFSSKVLLVLSGTTCRIMLRLCTLHKVHKTCNEFLLWVDGAKAMWVRTDRILLLVICVGKVTLNIRVVQLTATFYICFPFFLLFSLSLLLFRLRPSLVFTLPGIFPAGGFHLLGRGQWRGYLLNTSPDPWEGNLIGANCFRRN